MDLISELLHSSISTIFMLSHLLLQMYFGCVSLSTNWASLILYRRHGSLVIVWPYTLRQVRQHPSGSRGSRSHYRSQDVFLIYRTVFYLDGLPLTSNTSTLPSGQTCLQPLFFRQRASTSRPSTIPATMVPSLSWAFQCEGLTIILSDSSVI